MQKGHFLSLGGTGKQPRVARVRVPSLESHAPRELQHSTCARISALVRLHCDSPCHRWLGASQSLLMVLHHRFEHRQSKDTASSRARNPGWAASWLPRRGCVNPGFTHTAGTRPSFNGDPWSYPSFPGASAELGAAITAQMINLTLHEELLAESRASSHCRTTPQVLQARAPCTQ